MFLQPFGLTHTSTKIVLAGYSNVEPIYGTSETLVYRGIREYDRRPIIIKMLRNPYPSFSELARFRNAYAIANELNLPGVIKFYSLEHYHNSLAIVMEDIGGIALAEEIKKWGDAGMGKTREGISQFLNIGIEIANILEGLYRCRVIHKDIKPQNILINPDTRQIKLIDFSCASLLPRETQILCNPNAIEGTLAYMSPEQTGRMNRGIDYRSDFYSLGVTFYEMLTGKLPFIAEDAMELVHCHIAREPIAPMQINPAIPDMLNQITVKLMAKTPEERYQSASGLKCDLERCQQQWISQDKIERFELGKTDKSDRFIIPEKLYGREAESKTLLDTFGRVAAGSCEMILVTGFSGIGKSALVAEIHKPIVQKRGYFIQGKFDQFKRDIPFSAFVSAFRDLIRQLLGESQERVQKWQAKLQRVLGEDAQAIVDVIPEVRLLVGEPAPLTELSPTAAQNRFNLLFQKFISVFARSQHPLVIFLDDLQWADAASLKLLKLLMTETSASHLLAIAAYRDNEVNATHPFAIALEEIRNSQVTVNQIHLAPLDLGSVNQLIADTLHCSREQSLPLTELIFQKTQGNPFFSGQLLKSLHEEKLIVYNASEGNWQYDLATIQMLGVSGDVVEFMAQRLRKLSQLTREMLQLAACVGNEFDLQTLALVAETSLEETSVSLWEALQEGLILPEGEFYQLSYSAEELNGDRQFIQLDRECLHYTFIHDRVQQAAYALVPEHKKQQHHLKIGQLLLKHTSPEIIPDKIFDIVNQLNLAQCAIATQVQKDEIAALNLIAGRKAKSATAYELAVKYLTIGSSLLAAESWQHQYELTLTLHAEATEAEYLNTNFDRAIALAEIVLQHAKDLRDRVKMYELIVQMDMARMRMNSAIDTGIKVLEMLGVFLSQIPSDRSLWVELPSVENLAAIPEMSDPEKLAAMKLLIVLHPPVFQARPEMLSPLIVTMVNLCLTHGHSPLSAHAYGLYGLLLCGHPETISEGYYAGQIALKLLEQFPDKSIKTKVLDEVAAHINPWKEHNRASLPLLLEGIQSGLECGDLEYASYCIKNYCPHLLMVGESLENVEKQQFNYLELLLNLKQEFSIYYVKIWHQLTLNLLGKSAIKERLSGDSFDEDVTIPIFVEKNNQTLLFISYLAKTMLMYLFKNSAEALNSATLAAQYVEGVFGLMLVAPYYFYYSLALIDCCLTLQNETKKRLLLQLEWNQQKMKRWAEEAPMNYLHKYELVEAEKARLLGQNWLAMELYDRAIAGAKQHGYLHEEALASELAAEFYLAVGREKIAQTYLIEAYYGYARWEARAKVEDLEQRYGELLTSILTRPSSILDPLRSTSNQCTSCSSTASSTGSSHLLDLGSVMKASQALSSAIRLDDLLSTLMEVTIENAGAQKCALVLLKEDTLILEAMAVCAPGAFTAIAFSRPSLPVDRTSDIPRSVINYAWRTQEALILDNATTEVTWVSDSYIVEHQPKSILCTCIHKQGKSLGVLYLENNLAPGAFTRDRVELLQLITAQAAISLENALLYDNLEEKVQQRTQQLNVKNAELTQTLEELRQTQTQLIQTEKMSSLGQLVAGVAHEINNPVNFIYGNLVHANEYARDLLNVIQAYQQYYPTPVAPVQDEIEAAELDFLIEDFPNLLSSMHMGAKRIRDIVESLRNFSRLDEADFKEVDIHEGIDNTLLILQNRLKDKPNSPGIEVVKNYGNLPLVQCYASQLNQVFMNILSNAIDALNEVRQESVDYSAIVTIQTEVSGSNTAIVRISDNGKGMTEDVRQRIFDPFFTTKPVGKGTGLGLSISYQIVTEKHRGQLTCNSSLGQGTEFIIQIPIAQSVKN